jgi:hypothetical protein
MESVYAVLGYTIRNSQLRCTHLGYASAPRRMARLGAVCSDSFQAGSTVQWRAMGYGDPYAEVLNLFREQLSTTGAAR